MLQWTAALANGARGGTLEFEDTLNPQVAACTRVRDRRALSVRVNLSAQSQDFTIRGHSPASLEPWAWAIEPR